MVKVITLLTRKEGISHEEFSRYWEKEHGPLVAKLLHPMKRYVQNHIVTYLKGEEQPIDGIAEVWYDKLDSFRETGNIYESEVGKALRDAEENFIDRSKLVSFVVEEKVIK